jgi:hypothetical protein
MLRFGQQVPPDVVRQFEILRAINGCMRERRGAPSPPIFDRSVRIEHFGALIRPIARLQAGARAVDIDLLDIGNGNCVGLNTSPSVGVANRSLNEPRAAPAM